MDLEIDESYAKSFNEWKTKEDNSKTKKILKRKIEDFESFSGSESEDEIETTKMDDFAQKMDAFLAELNNNGKDALKSKPIWFENTGKPIAKAQKSKPLFGKDLNSQILLKRGDDDENRLRELDEISKIDSKEISKMAPKVDFSSFCNFESDIFTPAKNQREIKNLVPEEEDTIADVPCDSEESSFSEDEEVKTNESMMVLNMSRHGDTMLSKDTKRKDKRKQTKERKKIEMKETIKQLNNIKMKELEEKFEKIRKTNPSVLQYLKPEDLDDDFDPDKHNAIMERLFEQNGETYSEDEEKPVFSDDQFDYGTDFEDISFSNEKRKEKSVTDEAASEKSNKKRSFFANVDMPESEEKKPKEIYDPNEHGSFKKFMKKHAPIICDDIIRGVNGDHTLCKFKYRSVEPQNFGLTMDEIMWAENKDLNKWASLKKVVAIRTQDEEMRDYRHYNSKRKLQRKQGVLVSVYGDNVHEEEEVEEEAEEETKKSNNAKKRMRKALNKQKLREIVSNVEEKPKKKEKKSKSVNNETLTQNNEPKEKKSKDTEALSSADAVVEITEMVATERKAKKDQSKSTKPKAKKARIDSDLPILGSSRLKSLGVSEAYYIHGLKGLTKKKE